MQNKRSLPKPASKAASSDPKSDAASVEILKAKILAKVKESPKKAAIILTEWVGRKSNQAKKSKAA